MEENQENSSASKTLILVAVVAIIILVIAAGGFILVRKGSENSSERNVQSASNNSSISDQSSNTSRNAASYKDGTYNATGSYFTPGGTEQIGVSVTLQNGVIVKTELTQEGKSPTAKLKQADFAANYKPFVIGKNINDVNLTVVSGSSLTTRGFDNALDQIKTLAKSST